MSISNSFLDPPICALHVPLEDNYPGVCDGCSVWMIDCRKLDDPEHDVKLGIHVGRNPRIMRSILGSKDYHELHSRLYEGISRFLSIRNVVIMICESGRHRSVANSELWSSTLSRYGRFLHSVSLIHLSEHDFWKDTCAGKCGVQQTVHQNFSHTLRLRSCRMFTTRPRDRPSDRALEATTTGKLPPKS